MIKVRIAHEYHTKYDGILYDRSTDLRLCSTDADDDLHLLNRGVDLF